MGRACRMNGERRGACRVLVGKYEERKPLGRPKWIREDNIKVDLQKAEWGALTGLTWIRMGTGGGLL